MSRKKNDDRLAFVVSLEGDYRYRHWVARLCVVKHEKATPHHSMRTDYGDCPIEWPGCEYEREGLAYDLRVWSQGVDDDSPRKLYAWEVEYGEKRHIDFGDATRMAKCLGRVQRHMEKARLKHGNPASWAQFVGRAAEALGVKMFLFECKKAPGRYRECTVGEGIDRINSWVADWETRSNEFADAA